MKKKVYVFFFSKSSWPLDLPHDKILAVFWTDIKSNVSFTLLIPQSEEKTEKYLQSSCKSTWKYLSIYNLIIPETEIQKMYAITVMYEFHY